MIIKCTTIYFATYIFILFSFSQQLTIKDNHGKINIYLLNKGKQKLLEEINKTFGDIKDLYGATIPVFDMGGGSKLIPKFASGVMFADELGPLLKLYVKNGKLFVNTIIRDT